MFLYTLGIFIARPYQKRFSSLISYERNNLKGFSLCIARLARLARLGDYDGKFQEIIATVKG